MKDALQSFTIRNAQGSSATFLNRGLILQSLKIKMPEGGVRETVLGWEDPQDYLTSDYLEKEYPYMGAFIGRYANRVQQAQFTLESKTYSLPMNFPPHCLHGGEEGFDIKTWTLVQDQPHTLEASLHSPHMDQGFPGNCFCKVKFHLDEGHCLRMEIEARLDQPCPLNFTYHPYFNLNAQQTNDHDQSLWLNSLAYLETDEQGIPKGTLAYLESPLISTRQIRLNHGLDISLIAKGKEPHAILRSYDEKLALAIYSDAPILHLYSGENTPTITKQGKRLGGPYGSICLEPMQYTNALNKAEFPSTLYGPDRPYRQSIAYQFLL
jgi:aldose 1-epimerase